MFRIDRLLTRISSSLVLYRALVEVHSFWRRDGNGENENTWWYRTPSFFMAMQEVTPLMLSRTFWGAASGRFWKFLRSRPIWVHAITISSPKWKNHCEGPGTTQDMNLSWYRAVNTEHEQRWRADGARRLPNTWKKLINKGATILKVHKCCIPLNKAMSAISNSWHRVLSNPCILFHHSFCFQFRYSLRFIIVYKSLWMGQSNQRLPRT